MQCTKCRCQLTNYLTLEVDDPDKIKVICPYCDHGEEFLKKIIYKRRGIMKERIQNILKLMTGKKFLLLAVAVLLLKVSGAQATALVIMYMISNSFEKWTHIKYGNKD
jgi:hypothetical protein